MVDVILVDDDKIILKILSKKLEKLGLSVLTYQDSKLGLESIVANKPKVAILDLVMPGYSGSDLAIKLSENLIFQTTTIYLLTASELNENDRIRLHTLGFDQILKKPFSEADLIRIKSEHFQKAA
ncbi:MAG: hypothetical protein COW00_04560 [Bdellovibrio sp. CG12_big_fil_rev_8_21_14_0_65_39_13]|nr:MAG: hypothetical protein COW78_12760 [Bdellovibrio sp. CG22_combo_CG10-13_8_21_14_all_39_27]PIQ61081.1 MAG: hypothetical protein COW00_04560 [Bdellovibrio sp. CG12_big_fil_rev_8_21_14_0_65_39_13]PIR36849.1 MAG: hypothetical protein COV37_01580 [Bdellovibrio sp. CG11_big_fil_rev_8_21_14_0_20_39_38]